eukprot:snap_masked-scaffold61_size441589-processed-gene-3.15 protein:Tk06314 transcript:snap_masked-scaffold61_size441589-processed-gene-3.15-mRNA-1 annotation:"hypothetical protein TRIADDRAFT_50060"
MLGASFCPDAFFNASVSWNTQTPHVSACMQDTLLVGIPAVLLLALEPLWLWFKRSTSVWGTGFPVPRRFGRIFTLKVLLTTLLIASCLGQVLLKRKIPFHPSDWFQHAVFLGSYVFVSFFEIWEQWNLIANSPVIFLFWLTSALCEVPTVQDQIEYLQSHPREGAFWVVTLTHYPVIILQVLVHSFSDAPRIGDWSPDSTSSFPSSMVFSWLDKLAWNGYWNPIHGLGHVPKAPMVLLVDYVKAKIVNRIQGNRISLVLMLVRSLWHRLPITLVLGGLRTLLAFLPPILLKVLLLHCQSFEQEAWKGILWVTLLFLAIVFESVLKNQFLKQVIILAQQSHAALMCLVFQRVLQTRSKYRATTLGQLGNLITTDTIAIESSACIITDVIVTPIVFTLAMIFLCVELGLVASIGVVCFGLTIPLSAWASIHLHFLRQKILEVKDHRLHLMTEILAGIQILKMYTWESAILSKVGAIREQEVGILKSIGKFRVIAKFPLIIGPFLMLFLSFLMVSLIIPMSILASEQIFVSLALFSIMKRAAEKFPIALSASLNAWVSLQRISDFLNDVDELPHNDDPERSDIKDGDDAPNVLQIEEGDFVAVMAKRESNFVTNLIQSWDFQDSSGGPIGYVTQQPWLENSPIKNNILFGKSLDLERYSRTLKACGLDPELGQLPFGDEIPVGVNGSNLSDNLKHRVSLARAVYSEANLVVLDHPFLGMETLDANHEIMKNLLNPSSGLLKNKTKILVTGQRNLIELTSRIIVVVDEKIAFDGTFEALNDQENVEDLLDDFKKDYPYPSDASSTDDDINPVETLPGTREPLVEVDNNGRIPWIIYFYYFQTYGWSSLITTILLFLASHLLDVGSKFWLSSWAKENFQRHSNVNPIYYLGVYAVISLIQTLLIVVREFDLFTKCALTSGKIHHGVLSSALRFPLVFFTENSPGKILNRFSSDLNGIDDVIPIRFGIVLDCLCAIVMALLVICFNLPPFLIIILPILGLYFWMQSLYITTYRQLQRINVGSRSKILTFLTQLHHGVESIRAYQQEDHFLEESGHLINQLIQTSFTMDMMNRWLSLRMEVLSSVIVLFTSLLAVLARKSLPSSLIGLIIVFSLDITGLLNWLVEAISDLEAQSVALERLHEYNTGLQEDTEHGGDNWAPMSLDSDIQIQNLSVVHQEGLPWSLKDVSLHVPARSATLIVGPSGSGKSTITLALLRLLDPSSGVIAWDGKDMKDIPLGQLRASIGIVPQHPLILNGSIRFNLDPSGQWSDDQIWSVLEQMGQRDQIQALGSLDDDLIDLHSSLSMADKNAFSCVRLILKKCSVIVIDDIFDNLPTGVAECWRWREKGRRGQAGIAPALHEDLAFEVEPAAAASCSNSAMVSLRSSHFPCRITPTRCMTRSHAPSLLPSTSRVLEWHAKWFSIDMGGSPYSVTIDRLKLARGVSPSDLAVPPRRGRPPRAPPAPSRGTPLPPLPEEETDFPELGAPQDPAPLLSRPSRRAKKTAGYTASISFGAAPPHYRRKGGSDQV